MFKEKVATLLEKALEENESLFLIDFEITPSNTIYVVLDGDKGVSLQDCIKVSRAIEHNLDREETDFSLEVTSAGATSAIELPRQYKKNIGRKLKVVTAEATLEGNLTDVSSDSITLQWKAREPSPLERAKLRFRKSSRLPFLRLKKQKLY